MLHALSGGVSHLLLLACCVLHAVVLCSDLQTSQVHVVVQFRPVLADVSAKGEGAQLYRSATHAVKPAVQAQQLLSNSVIARSAGKGPLLAVLQVLHSMQAQRSFSRELVGARALCELYVPATALVCNAGVHSSA